jgi:hypothetical protein
VVVGAAEPAAGAAAGASDGVAEPALELEPVATTAEPVAGFGGSPQPSRETSATARIQSGAEVTVV